MSKPIFARRHYEAIAQAMQEACPMLEGDAQIYYKQRTQWEACLSELASTFKVDNSAFSRARFARACEPLFQAP